MIGISFQSPASITELFRDWMNQYIIYFAFVLAKTSKVVLIVDKPLPEKFPTLGVQSLTRSDPKVSECTLVFQMGFEFTEREILGFHQRRTKFIVYPIDNVYMREMEHILFSTKESTIPQFSRFKHSRFVTQVWIPMSMESIHRDFLQTRYRCPVKIVPFVWSPVILQSRYTEFTPPKGGYRIVTFDTNDTFGKYALPSVLVCESAYRVLEDKTKLVKVLVTHTLTFNRKMFSRMTYSTDLYRDKKIFAEKNYLPCEIMSKYGDAVVSHQWDYPLQYMYLELAWMGYPVIHNSALCKDIGYYYPDFEYQKGGEQLIHVLNTHHKVYLEYMKQNRKNITRFLTSNPDLIQEYKHLVNNVPS